MSKYIGTPVVSLVTDTVDVTGDITTTDATPEVIIVNDTSEDTDGGREGKVTFKGQQSGGEETTLAQIQASHDGTSDDEKGDLIFKTNDGSDGASPTEAMRIDSSQNILIGAGNTSSVGVGGGTGIVQIADTSAIPISAIRYANSSAGPFIMMGKTRSATVGTVGSVVSDGDDLGTIRFLGDDGTDMENTACSILGIVDGSVSGNSIPGRFEFWQHDGSQNNETIRINKAGSLHIQREHLQIQRAGNNSTNFTKGGLVFATPAYNEYHYTWSGQSSYTIDLTCASYFHCEFIYTQHQTNGGNEMHYYARGKWANNHVTHTGYMYEMSGDGGGLSVSFTVSDQGGNGSVDMKAGLTAAGASGAGRLGVLAEAFSPDGQSGSGIWAQSAAVETPGRSAASF